MADVISKLHELDPAFRELVGLLYPSGVLSKSSPGGSDMHVNGNVNSDAQAKKERRIAATGMAATGVAAAGGLHAIHATGQHYKATKKAIDAGEAVKAGPIAGKLGLTPKKALIAGTAGWAALHGVELGADALSARAQRRDYKDNNKSADTMAKAAGMVPRRPAGAPTDPLRQANRIGRLQKLPGMANEGLTAARIGKGFRANMNLVADMARTSQGANAQFDRGVRAKAAAHDAFKAKVKGKFKSLGSEVGTTLEQRGRQMVHDAITPKPVVKPKNPPGKLLAIGAGGGAVGVLAAQNSHNKNLNKSITLVGEIAKVDVDKRQVFGWCSISEMDGVPYVDLQGDFIPVEEIEKSAYRYVLESRKGGDMHARVRKGLTTNFDEPKHTGDLIESFVVTPEKLEVMGLDRNAMPHGWWVGYKINDDEQWAMVKSGERSGFSLHGVGSRRDMELP